MDLHAFLTKISALQTAIESTQSSQDYYQRAIFAEATLRDLIVDANSFLSKPLGVPEFKKTGKPEKRKSGIYDQKMEGRAANGKAADGKAANGKAADGGASEGGKTERRKSTIGDSKSGFYSERRKSGQETPKILDKSVGMDQELLDPSRKSVGSANLLRVRTPERRKSGTFQRPTSANSLTESESIKSESPKLDLMHSYGKGYFETPSFVGKKAVREEKADSLYGSSLLRSTIAISRNNSLKRCNSQGSIKEVKKRTDYPGIPFALTESIRPLSSLLPNSLETGEKPRGNIRFSKVSKFNLNLDGDLDGDALPKVVVPNPKAKVHVDVEVPLQSKVQSYNMTVKPDIYSDLFFWRPHWNWVGCMKNKPNEFFFISVLKELELGVCKGVKNSMSGFNEFSFEMKGKTKVKKSSVEKKLLEHWPGIRIVEITDGAASSDIQQIEKKFPQYFSAMDVSIIEILEGQTNPQEMFQNKLHSPAFDTFLKIMGITLPLTEKTEFDWNDKKVRYLIASQLNEEQIRRLIGNTENVILFNSATVPFDPVHIDAMGAIPQTFIVVQPYTKNTYRMGSFHRFDNSFPPFVPKNYIFPAFDIKEFVLTKIYNGLMTSRNCPPYSIMYERPRLHYIREIADKHLSSKALATLIAKKE